MPKIDRASRDRIVQTSLSLLRRGGLSASGLNNLVTEGAVPKGSIYYFFPGGKKQIVLEALQRNQELTAKALSIHLGGAGSLSERVGSLFRDLADRMSKGGFTSSCAIGAVALDIGSDDVELRQACGSILSGWIHLVASHMGELSPSKRQPSAQFLISLLEGAQVSARALRSSAPILNAAASFVTYLEGLTC
jgi:TetR/AcrR family transcriptional regulator, lmrAB and yxaGH operons repressor